MPWCTITRCAPAAAARSKTSSEDETPHAIFVTSSAPSTCRPGVPYSGKRWISSSSFAYLMISSRWAMGSIIATLCALGVWRSLVARSVRVGEVRSSNLRTPIGKPRLARGFLLLAGDLVQVGAAAAERRRDHRDDD